MMVLLLGEVNHEEIMINLLQFYSRIEEYLATRLPIAVWSHAQRREGAKEAIDSFLRKFVGSDLKQKLPGVGISWDDQINIAPVYSSSSIALVDLVDGAKEYVRQGTAVTSHLGIYQRNGKELGELQLGIVSYPFHRFRIITIGDQVGQPVYYLPFEFDILAGPTKEKLEKGLLKKPIIKKDISLFNVVDRYVQYDRNDKYRSKIDALRSQVIESGGSYTVTRGSVAKTIIDVALGVSDISICKHDPEGNKKIPFHDYLTPSKILHNSGGIFVDLGGEKPNGKNSIDGFIAAATSEIFELFWRELNGSI